MFETFFSFKMNFINNFNCVIKLTKKKKLNTDSSITNIYK